MREMIFWGATGQAKVLRECMRPRGIRLSAVVDARPVPPPFSGVPLLLGKAGFEAWLSSRPDVGEIGFLVAIGGEGGRDRLQLQRYLESFGLVPLVARHETAFIADGVAIGPGSQVLAQAAVCVDARIGAGVIVNTSASVDHECTVGDGVHVCPGAKIAGCVAIDPCATIGTGAVVLPRVHVGEGAVVGAGAVVLRDVEPRAVVVGNPARKVGEREV